MLVILCMHREQFQVNANSHLQNTIAYKILSSPEPAQPDSSSIKMNQFRCYSLLLFRMPHSQTNNFQLNNAQM